MSYPRRAIAGVTAVVLAAGITAVVLRERADQPARQQQQQQETVSLGRTATVALTTLHDCSDLLQYYQRAASQLVGPYGLNGGPIYPMAAGVATNAVPKAMSGASEGAVTTSGTAAVPNSATNVQVAGVDESDVVKNSGDLLVSTVNGAVQVTRLAGRRTRTIATWRPADGSAESVLLDGSMAVILENSSSRLRPLGLQPMIKFAGGMNGGSTELTVLDLSDPSRPRPVRRLQLDGNPTGAARLVDGEVRLAVTAEVHGLAWKQPVYSSSPMSPAQSQRAEKHATAANRALIAGSTIGNWLPQATVTSLNPAGRPDGPAVRRPLLDCSQVEVPSSFSGLQTLALVSVDLRTGTPLSAWRAAGVVAAGSTLYATADHAWLSTSRWGHPSASGVNGGVSSSFAPLPGSTQIHLFDTPLRAEPRYVASGEVAGTLLDQYSMDERAGVLRVASTTDADWRATRKGMAPVPSAAGQSLTQSEGRISVLRVDGDRLARVGVLTGLGVGERIRGVRFDGDVGYLDTYRQMDPLYTVDLSNPEQPRLCGQLELAGYSAYLQPLGPGRVLGLGQDGTTTGQITGLQLTLFDVSDLDDPRRLARQRLAGSWSDAEADHHAFTLAGDLVLVPYTEWVQAPVTSKNPAGQRFDTGVIAVRISADRLGSPVILRPLATGPIDAAVADVPGNRYQKVLQATPMRTVVQAGMIYTLTPAGVAVHSASSFARRSFVSF